MTINSERRTYGPYGLQGGGPGQVGINRVIRGGDETIVGAKVTVQVNPGDGVVIETPGGGGWG